jgi:hypothetical protein
MYFLQLSFLTFVNYTYICGMLRAETYHRFHHSHLAFGRLG